VALFLILVFLAIAGVCLSLLWWSDQDRIVATFEVGPGRTISIIEEGGWQEHTQTVLYRIEEEGRQPEERSLDFISLQEYPRGMDYCLLKTTDGSVVALVKESSPGEVFLLYSFETHRAYPSSELDVDPAGFDAASKRLMAEYPTRRFYFNCDQEPWGAASPQGDSQWPGT
jgi:hypothetical protein